MGTRRLKALKLHLQTSQRGASWKGGGSIQSHTNDRFFETCKSIFNSLLPPPSSTHHPDFSIRFRPFPDPKLLSGRFRVTRLVFFFGPKPALFRFRFLFLFITYSILILLLFWF